MKLSTWLHFYIKEQERVVRDLGINDGVIADAIELINRARTAGKKVLVAGNGGSAANASHFAQDVTKGASNALECCSKKPLLALSLTDNVSWITALGNDFSYEDIFVEQLCKVANPKDVFVAISVSGTSDNLTKAASFAQRHGMKVISIIGSRPNKKNKPHLADLSDVIIQVNESHFGRAEDAQMTVLHAIAYYFQENTGDL